MMVMSSRVYLYASTLSDNKLTSQYAMTIITLGNELKCEHVNMLVWFLSFCSTEAISGTNITGPNSPLIAGNSTVNLTCTAKAGKSDEVLWSKDGKPLSSTQRVMFSLDKSVVTISPVQKGDAGVYKCELKNKISSDLGTYPLMVNCKLINCAFKMIIENEM